MVFVVNRGWFWYTRAWWRRKKGRGESTGLKMIAMGETRMWSRNKKPCQVRTWNSISTSLSTDTPLLFEQSKCSHRASRASHRSHCWRRDHYVERSRSFLEDLQDPNEFKYLVEELKRTRCWFLYIIFFGIRRYTLSILVKYVAGGSLITFLRSFFEALTWSRFKQVVVGFVYFHEKDIICRDIQESTDSSLIRFHDVYIYISNTSESGEFTFKFNLLFLWWFWCSRPSYAICVVSSEFVIGIHFCMAHEVAAQSFHIFMAYS